jgi:hypothetical protein
VLSTAPITVPSCDKAAGICPIVAVVDTRSLVGARNHCEGSVNHMMSEGSLRKYKNKQSTTDSSLGKFVNLFLLKKYS